MAIQPTRVKFPVITEVDTALLAAVNSLPLPRAAERLFNLSSRIVRDGPPEARGEEVFGELLVQHDPFEPGFAENLDAVLPFGNPAVVGSLLARFPNHSPVIALRQVWAIAAARPLMAAFLARGVLSAPVAAALPEIVPEMQRLVALALEVAPRPYYARNDEGTGPLRGSALARALVSCLKNEGGIPPLGGWTAAKSGLQLRFHWAAMAQRNREAAELLTAAMEITGVTVYLLERELTRGAAAWSRAGRPLAKLPAVKSVYLPERVQRWLQKSACLRSLVLKDAPTPYLRWSRKQQAVRLATERLVEQIQDALQSADYRRAGKLLLKVPNGAVADDVLREKLTPPPPMPAQLISHIVSAKARRSPHWLPMAPQAADTWRKRVPKVPLSEWWPCTVDEVVAGLVANRWTWRDIRVVERARLQVSWKTAHQKALLSANLFAAVTGTSRVWRSAGPRVAFSLARTATAAAVPLMREALLGMPNLRPLLEYVSESPNPESLRQDYAVLMSALQTAQGDDRGHALRFRLEAPLIGTPEWNQAPEWIREPKYFLAKMPAYLQHGGKPLNLPGFVAVFEQELSTTQWPSAEIAAALLSWAKVRPESARRLLARLSVDVLASLLKLPQLPAG
ncbi:MAG: hypothetical protein RJB26_2356, partial [Pseudomonadota bacterium]